MSSRPAWAITSKCQRGEWGEKGKGQEDRVGARRQEQEREEGVSSPFYSESDTPGHCQVTVGQTLDKMLAHCVSLHFSIIFL